jgi:hypothetical protein
MTKPKDNRCSICAEVIVGFGHNGAPYRGGVCDACNRDCVVPIRLMMAKFADRRRHAVAEMKQLRSEEEVGA